MSTSIPAKYCPRCNTLLPIQAPVCSTCGLQFDAYGNPANPIASQPPPAYGSQPSTAYGAPTIGAPGAPAGWPQSQPGFMPQAMPGPVGYAPSAVAAPPNQIGNRTILIGLLVIAVIIGAVFYVNANHSSSPAFDRHGLPANIPLPNGVTFKLQQAVTEQSGEVDNEWFWTTDSPNDPVSIEQFYKDNLPSNGWTHIQPFGPESGEYIVLGCQSNQIMGAISGASLQVRDGQGNLTNTITAPSGGSALEIITTSDSRAISSACG